MSKILSKNREKPMTFVARHNVSEDGAAMSASVNQQEKMVQCYAGFCT